MSWYYHDGIFSSCNKESQPDIEYKMSKTLQMKRLDPTIIKANRVLLITGKRGTGKTTLLEHLLYRLRDRFDVVMGMGGSHASVKMLEGFLPSGMVYGAPIVRKVEKMVDMAKSLVEAGKKREFLLILDDCTFRKDIFKYPVFREIFMNGRNYGITFIISAQYIMDLETDLRSQIDYVFTFKEMIRANQKRLWEYFYGMIDNFRDFQIVLQTNTKNYECLVMDNTDPTGQLEKILYYFKAPMNTPNFTMGKSIYFSLDQRYRKQKSQCDDNLYKKLAATSNEPANSDGVRNKRLIISRA
jgi:hypothetical protein